MKMEYKFLLILSTAFVFQDSKALLQGATKLSILQHKLIEDLLKNYDKDSHPGGNSTVMVTLGAKLARLVKVEEVNNIIKAQWWMKQTWYNPDLRWNKSSYGDIDAIFVEPTRIWVPDVILYNNGDEKVDAAGGPEKYKTKIKVENNGMHTWLAPSIFTSMCKMDIRYFPFDEQFCDLQFGSWSYDSSKIDLQVDENETKIHKVIYQENNEWKVTSLKAKNRSKRYPCCKYPYTDILVTLHMHRRSYHYVVNLVFPCAVIAAMVFCTFFLPAESGERISLCITVLMAMTIFQELTSEKLPVSSEGFILIEMYYTACIVAISLAIFATCIVLNFYYKRTTMPRWLRCVLLGPIARIVGIETKAPQEQKPERQQTFSNSVASGDDDQDNNSVVILKSINRVNSQQNNEIVEENETKLENHTNGAPIAVLRRRKTSEKTVVSDVPNKVLEVNNEDDWRKASRVIDRFSMGIGLVMAVSSTAAIFLQAPRVRDFFIAR